MTAAQIPQVVANVAKPSPSGVCRFFGGHPVFRKRWLHETCQVFQNKFPGSPGRPLIQWSWTEKPFVLVRIYFINNSRVYIHLTKANCSCRSIYNRPMDPIVRLTYRVFVCLPKIPNPNLSICLPRNRCQKREAFLGLKNPQGGCFWRRKAKCFQGERMEVHLLQNEPFVQDFCKQVWVHRERKREREREYRESLWSPYKKNVRN